MVEVRWGELLVLLLVATAAMAGDVGVGDVGGRKAAIATQIPSRCVEGRAGSSAPLEEKHGSGQRAVRGGGPASSSCAN